LGVYVSAAETQRLTALAEELREQLAAFTAEWEELMGCWKVLDWMGDLSCKIRRLPGPKIRTWAPGPLHRDKAADEWGNDLPFWERQMDERVSVGHLPHNYNPFDPSLKDDPL